MRFFWNVLLPKIFSVNSFGELWGNCYIPFLLIIIQPNSTCGQRMIGLYKLCTNNHFDTGFHLVNVLIFGLFLTKIFCKYTKSVFALLIGYFVTLAAPLTATLIFDRIGWDDHLHLSNQGRYLVSITGIFK